MKLKDGSFSVVWVFSFTSADEVPFGLIFSPCESSSHTTCVKCESAILSANNLVMRWFTITAKYSIAQSGPSPHQSLQWNKVRDAPISKKCIFFELG